MTKKQNIQNAASSAVTMNVSEALKAQASRATREKKETSYSKQFKSGLSLEEAANAPGLQPQRRAILKAILIASKTLGKEWVPAKDVIDVAVRVQDADGSLNHGYLYMPKRIEVTEENVGSPEHRAKVIEVMAFYDKPDWRKDGNGAVIYEVRG